MSGLTSRAPEVIAAIIHNLLYKKRENDIQYFFGLLRRQFQDYTEIHGLLSQDV